jgi:translation initiation factor 3 subunit M
MATSTNQFVFIDGTFGDLATELAGHLAIESEIQPLLEENKKDEVLKKLVAASIKLNSTPEKEFTAAYNLLIYLVMQSPSVNQFLQKMCQNLSQPITSSPINGPGLALNSLTTIFNLLSPDNDVRANVFTTILRLVKASGLYEVLKPQLKKIDTWVKEWDLDEEDQRKLYVDIADAAEQVSEEEYVWCCHSLIHSTDLGSTQRVVPIHIKGSPNYQTWR